MSPSGGIFADSSGRRWSRFWLFATLGVLVTLALVIAFVQTLLVTPSLLAPGQAVDPGATDKFLRTARSAALALGLPRVTLLGPAAPLWQCIAYVVYDHSVWLHDFRQTLHI